jgi:hypothetical protein
MNPLMTTGDTESTSEHNGAIVVGDLMGGLIVGILCLGTAYFGALALNLLTYDRVRQPPYGMAFVSRATVGVLVVGGLLVLVAVALDAIYVLHPDVLSRTSIAAAVMLPVSSFAVVLARYFDPDAYYLPSHVLHPGSMTSWHVLILGIGAGCAGLLTIHERRRGLLMTAAVMWGSALVLIAAATGH